MRLTNKVKQRRGLNRVFLFSPLFRLLADKHDIKHFGVFTGRLTYAVHDVLATVVGVNVYHARQITGR